MRVSQENIFLGKSFLKEEVGVRGVPKEEGWEPGLGGEEVARREQVLLR